jgi:hypothetical protein
MPLPDYYAEERRAAARSRRLPWRLVILLAGLVSYVCLLPRRKRGT